MAVAVDLRVYTGGMTRMTRVGIGVAVWFVASCATGPIIGAMLHNAAAQFPLVEDYDELKSIQPR